MPKYVIIFPISNLVDYHYNEQSFHNVINCQEPSRHYEYILLGRIESTPPRMMSSNDI